ncbi:hypothetical protein ElyMa_003172900 [Elysia marginata]|uniref:Uncharacterized protein n=1 Tax=Elysia marginata TaxID=1093978 RepID=A0AAV4IWV3_9GAST|nr:hypothetical protein ElyMa_003172900 [Elysia marginata]
MPEKLSSNGLEEKFDTLDQLEAEFLKKLHDFCELAKEKVRGPNSAAVFDEVVTFLTQPFPDTKIPSENVTDSAPDKAS